MKFRTFLKSIPIMTLMALLGVGALAAPVGAAVGTWTMSAATGAPGTPISVTGTGFTPNNAFTIAWQGVAQPVASGTTDASGNLSTTFAVPTVTRGVYTNVVNIVATGDTPVAKSFTVIPGITLNPPLSTQIGLPVTVTGSGFAASVAVNIFFNAGTTPISQVTQTLSNGTFSQQFLMPQVPNVLTPYAVTAVEPAFPSSTASAGITVLPRIISISPELGAVGETVLVNADGFAPSGSVSIFLDNVSNTALTTVSANSAGVLPPTNITIPAATRGGHTIIVRDNTHTTLTATKTFTINQSKITANPTAGVVGSVATINGNGFAAGVTVAFEFDGSPFANTTTVTTDTNGSFTKTGIIIPTAPSGLHVITARVTSDSTMFAQVNFTVNSKITVTPTTGSTGDSVTITGTGFYPNGQITLAYDSVALATAPATLTVLPDGNFNGVFTVPGAGEGGHTIIAADGLGNIATTGFNSTITASLTPDTSATAGFVGQDITVTGNGFKPNATITVKLENNSVATGTSNTAGAFTITFKAPVSVKGAHPVTVSDGQTTKPFTFTMEGTAPQSPTLTEPATGIKAKQPITFTWGAVTDQSNPVTYKLEVAIDANFTTLILSKENLTTTSYTTTDAEELPTVSKKAPYYWRVIATDAAGNVSTPSTANSFVVGFSWADVPVWAWVTIGFFAVVIIGGGVYLLLKRRSAY